MMSKFKNLIIPMLVATSVCWSHNLSALDLNDQAYGLLKSILAYDKTYPLRARTTGQFERKGYKIERFAFESFHDGSVPGFLALPDASKAPYPVVLLLHGITSNKESWLKGGFTQGEKITEGLLEQGYAVLALDAQYHGERLVNNDYIDAGDMVFKKQWFMRYSNLISQTIVDYRRVIDYLETRDDIDTQRIGALGYSMGGQMTFPLSVVEPRIKAVVACVIPIREEFPVGADTFARGMGQVPLLMIMGTKDQYYTREQAQGLYDKVAGPNKSIKFYDSGHSLPTGYTGEAVKWFLEHL